MIPHAPAAQVVEPTRAAEFWSGARAITPLIIGALPFGLIFGALATTSGLSAPAAAAMSAFVFAGSAQFVAAGLIAGGALPAIIILTTLVVNLRHVLYGVTLSGHLRGLPQRWLVPLGFLLTDEAFVIAIRRYSTRDPSPYKHWFYLGAASTLYVNWQLCTWVGIWAGRAVTDPRAWGLEFALPLTFIGILMPMLVNRSLVLCALVAGLTALLLHDLPHQLGLVLATLIGVTGGILAERARPYPNTQEVAHL